MSIDTISQFGVIIFGGSAIWVLGRREYWNRWGYIIGLCSQPFFLYTTFVNSQWGLFVLSIFYTYSWVQGIYNHWIITPYK